MQSFSEWPRLTEYQAQLQQFISFFKTNHPLLKTKPDSYCQIGDPFSNLNTQQQKSKDETSVSKRIKNNNIGIYSPITTGQGKIKNEATVQDIDFNISGEELNYNNLKPTKNLPSLKEKRLKENLSSFRMQSKSRLGSLEEIKLQSPNTEESSLNKISFQRDSTKNNLQQLIQLVITYHNINEQKLRQLRIQVENESPSLLVIFDQLIFKYDNISKSKEEVIKFIIRKTVKQIKLERNESQQKAQKSIDGKPTNDSEDEGPLGPYKSFKSINQSLLKTLFNSDKFVQRYNQLLSDLPRMIDHDNQKKISRLTVQVVGLLKKKQAPKNYFKQVKRLPWTEKNKDYAVRIAQELLEQGKSKI